MMICDRCKQPLKEPYRIEFTKNPDNDQCEMIGYVKGDYCSKCIKEAEDILKKEWLE